MKGKFAWTSTLGLKRVGNTDEEKAEIRFEKIGGETSIKIEVALARKGHCGQVSETIRGIIIGTTQYESDGSTINELKTRRKETSSVFYQQRRKSHCTLTSFVDITVKKK